MNRSEREQSWPRLITEATICGLTDWMERPLFQYESNGNWWHRVAGGWFQVAWFKAHNNRLYRWAAFPRIGEE